VHLVPNLPRKLSNTVARVRAKAPGELRLVSVGRIAVEKNMLFAIERLNGIEGNVTFDLYGPIYDEAYWRLCQQAIEGLGANVRVAHKGVMDTENVTEEFARAHALFMPSLGENFGHSMIEALSTGLPLVISDRTPWRDLERQHAGWDLPLERPAAFTQAIQELVDMDQVAYDRWSAGAFALGARYLADPAPIEKSLALFLK
jgi:glycosyltransferase involved in cell wall biosynthesis